MEQLCTSQPTGLWKAFLLATAGVEMGVNSCGCLAAVWEGVSGGLLSASRPPRVCRPPGWLHAVLAAHQRCGGNSNGFCPTTRSCIPSGSFSRGNLNLKLSPSIFPSPPMCQTHNFILVVMSMAAACLHVVTPAHHIRV